MNANAQRTFTASLIQLLFLPSLSFLAFPFLSHALWVLLANTHTHKQKRARTKATQIIGWSEKQRQNLVVVCLCADDVDSFRVVPMNTVWFRQGAISIIGSYNDVCERHSDFSQRSMLNGKFCARSFSYRTNRMSIADQTRNRFAA